MTKTLKETFGFTVGRSLSLIGAASLMAFSFEFAAARELSTPRQDFIACEGVDGEVRFEIMFETADTTLGPQVLAMRVSDPYVSEARSEIARFDSADGLLNNTGGVIVGYVDPTNPKTGRVGERIGGTTLGQLRSIMVSLEGEAVSTVVASMVSGKRYSAQAVYLKKIGQELVQDLDCIREK